MSLEQSKFTPVKKKIISDKVKPQRPSKAVKVASGAQRCRAKLRAWICIIMGAVMIVVATFILPTANASSSALASKTSDSIAKDTSTDDILTTDKSKFCTSIQSINTTADKLIDQNPTLRQDMVRLGMNAYCYALKHSQNNLQNKHYLTLVDFSKPSFEKRMFVIDLDSMKIKMALNVAHGKNSGLATTTSFSNRLQSKESSLGVFTTSQIYVGKHGRSLRLNGLEKGINDNAMRRDVVMHCAPYVSDEFIKLHHRAGRSWGCFAVSPAVCGHLVDLLQNGSILFAFALPEREDRNINPA